MAEKPNLMDWLQEQTAELPDQGVTELALRILNQIDAASRRQGLSRTELAERAGVNRAYVSRILNNPANVTLGTIVRLANALGLEVQAPLIVPRQQELDMQGLVVWLEGREGIDGSGGRRVEQVPAAVAA